MIRATKRVVVIGVCATLTLSGCSFQGLNSLPLPGAVGRGPDAATYHVELENVSTLESNSPVLIVLVAPAASRGTRRPIPVVIRGP